MLGSVVLGMSRRTVYAGIDELKAMSDDDHDHLRRPSGDAKRIRRPGGGRPKATRTQTGLHVKARILDKIYDIGRKCSDTFRDIKDQFIRHDNVLGQWNYVVDARGVGPRSCARASRVRASPID